MTGAERGIWLDDPADREDLSTFADRAQRLDDAAVVRLRARPAGGVVAWFATGFDVLASRVVDGRIRPADLCAGADQLQSGLGAEEAGCSCLCYSLSTGPLTAFRAYAAACV